MFVYILILIIIICLCKSHKDNIDGFGMGGQLILLV